MKAPKKLSTVVEGINSKSTKSQMDAVELLTEIRTDNSRKAKLTRVVKMWSDWKDMSKAYPKTCSIAGVAIVTPVCDDKGAWSFPSVDSKAKFKKAYAASELALRKFCALVPELEADLDADVKAEIPHKDLALISKHLRAISRFNHKIEKAHNGEGLTVKMNAIINEFLGEEQNKVVRSEAGSKHLKGVRADAEAEGIRHSAKKVKVA